MTTSKLRLAALLGLSYFFVALATNALAQGPITLAFMANVVGYVEPCG